MVFLLIDDWSSSLTFNITRARGPSIFTVTFKFLDSNASHIYRGVIIKWQQWVLTSFCHFFWLIDKTAVILNEIGFKVNCVHKRGRQAHQTKLFTQNMQMTRLIAEHREINIFHLSFISMHFKV